MGAGRGQFIILTAAIILIVVVALVAVIHQSTTTPPPSPPPIYAAIATVDQSIRAILVEADANYTHTVIAQEENPCGATSTATLGGGQRLQTLFDEELENLTYIYSGYGLQLEPQSVFLAASWCTGPLGGGSTSALATVTFNLTSLGLTGYRYEAAYTLEAHSAGCSLGATELVCTLEVSQDGSPLTGLNQSYFYLMSPAGWAASNLAVDYDNGTYTVGWPAQEGGQPSPIAVENQLGVYVVLYPPPPM